MIKIISLPLFLILSALAASAELVHYQIDPVHSGIEFKVRHFLNKIPGTFASFSGDIHFDKEEPGNSKATATIEVKSIDTRNDKRDGHLQTEDYFNAPAHPSIVFTSTKWTATGENSYKVEGVLEMMGVAKPVELDVQFLGEMEARGKMISGWAGSTEIDRTEWGLTGGQPAVGKDVEIELNIQARRQ